MTDLVISHESFDFREHWNDVAWIEHGPKILSEVFPVIYCPSGYYTPIGAPASFEKQRVTKEVVDTFETRDHEGVLYVAEAIKKGVSNSRKQALKVEAERAPERVFNQLKSLTDSPEHKEQFDTEFPNYSGPGFVVTERSLIPTKERIGPYFLEADQNLSQFLYEEIVKTAQNLADFGDYRDRLPVDARGNKPLIKAIALGGPAWAVKEIGVVQDPKTPVVYLPCSAYGLNTVYVVLEPFWEDPQGDEPSLDAWRFAHTLLCPLEPRFNVIDGIVETISLPQNFTVAVNCALVGKLETSLVNDYIDINF